MQHVIQYVFHQVSGTRNFEKVPHEQQGRRRTDIETTFLQPILRWRHSVVDAVCKVVELLSHLCSGVPLGQVKLCSVAIIDLSKIPKDVEENMS